jgi:rRNA maturation endonuclease Nob1
MLLIVWLSVVLLTTSVLIILWNRQKRKNAEHQLYESALLAELKQSESEQTQKRMKQQLEQKPTKAMIGKITEWMSSIYMEKAKKNAYLQKLSEVDIDMLEQGYLTADEKISNMDMKYIICFAIDMEVEDMSLLFNVQPASIHTVRYRIKKKFRGKNTFKFLM